MRNSYDLAKERLRQILGSRLADKLVEETKRASTEYAKLVSGITAKALEDRMALTNDELAEARFNLVREEAAEILKTCMAVFVACEVVRLSCVLHSAQNISMTEYVTHVVGHYEDEQKKRRDEKIANIVEAITAYASVDEEDIHHAAKSHSSGN